MFSMNPVQLAQLLGEWRGEGSSRDALATRLRALILDGRISLDTRLPAERVLALALGISRNTVGAAYGVLANEGYLRNRQGSGSFASVPGGHRGVIDSLSPGDGVDLRVAAMPAPAILQELALDAARDLPRWLDHHGYEPLGLPPLRQAIARHFTTRGLATKPEQVLVTNGALHAFDLVVRTLLPRASNVIVELPSYPAALDALRAARCRLKFVPVTTGGWDLTAFEAIVRSENPALAFLIPDFQNPTGALMDSATRELVIGRLSRAGVMTVIDETFAGLSLDERESPMPAAAAGRAVITLGSLGKVAWGGLRIGWVRAEPSTITRLATARGGSDMASPVLDQLVGLHVLDNLEHIVSDRRDLLRQRYHVMTDALSAELPSWRWTPPAGGMVIWAELPTPTSTHLSIKARELGISLAPGPRFGADGLLERYLRLPFSQAPDRLEDTVRKLASLSNQELSRGSTDRQRHYIA